MEINVCPRWLLSKLAIPPIAQTHAAFLISALVALVSSPLLIHIPHFCLAQKVLGIPCPGCGVMHSLAAVVHLQFAAAWNFNPAGVVFAFYLLVQMSGHALALVSTVNEKVLSRILRVGQISVMTMLFAVWSLRLLRL